MGELLEELRGLQAVALELVGIEQNLAARKRRATARLRQVKQADEKLEQNKRATQQYQLRIDHLSLEIASREESQNKHRQALNSAKTNKDYAAILAAMNTEKADTAKIEAAVLELMREVESLNAAASVIEAEKSAAEAEVEKANKSLEELEAKCKPQLDKLTAKREKLSADLPREALSMFERAASRHEGEAMAEVVKGRGRAANYNCGGCNMTVTLEIVNALQSKNSVQRCASCSRILYLEPAAAAKS